MGIILSIKSLFVIILHIWILVRVVSIHKNRSKGQFLVKREIVFNVFSLYIFCFIGITLFPLFISFTGEKGYVGINIVPVFNTIKDVANIMSDSQIQNFMIKF